jgi:hypothetical protein
MEQVLDWLNENETRSFPLLDDFDKAILLNDDYWLLPENFILDLQLTTQQPLLTTITREVVPVVLHSITLSADETITVTFSAGVHIASFVITSHTTQTYPLYIRNPDGNLAVFGSGVSSFVSAAQGAVELVLDIPVEPSVCIQFNGPWLGVNGISVSPEKVSLDPLLADVARSYEPSLPLADVGNPTVLTGDITLFAGYNFRVNISENLIDLEVGYGYGLLMNCATSFIPEEYLDCGDIVSYINGIPPDSSGNFRLLAGSNINIIKGATIPEDFYDNLEAVSHNETANKHSLFVGLNFQSTDLCAPIPTKPAI